MGDDVGLVFIVLVITKVTFFYWGVSRGLWSMRYHIAAEKWHSHVLWCCWSCAFFGSCLIKCLGYWWGIGARCHFVVVEGSRVYSVWSRRLVPVGCLMFSRIISEGLLTVGQLPRVWFLNVFDLGKRWLRVSFRKCVAGNPLEIGWEKRWGKKSQLEIVRHLK